MTTDTTRYRVQEGANEVGLGGRSLHIVRPSGHWNAGYFDKFR